MLPNSTPKAFFCSHMSILGTFRCIIIIIGQHIWLIFVQSSLFLSFASNFVKERIRLSFMYKWCLFFLFYSIFDQKVWPECCFSWQTYPRIQHVICKAVLFALYVLQMCFFRILNPPYIELPGDAPSSRDAQHVDQRSTQKTTVFLGLCGDGKLFVL